MQTFLIGGCPFCDKQDCIAGQCRSVDVEEVFSFPEEFTVPADCYAGDWAELMHWWDSGNEEWDVLKGIVSKMLESNKG